MELVFLEAASALRLTKQITNKKTTPYPHVRKINSHHYQIEKTNKGLKEFETLLRSHAAKGNCLLKGPLKKQLKKQSNTEAPVEDFYEQAFQIVRDDILNARNATSTYFIDGKDNFNDKLLNDAGFYNNFSIFEFIELIG